MTDAFDCGLRIADCGMFQHSAERTESAIALRRMPSTVYP
jgi:hypothetical protein